MFKAFTSSRRHADTVGAMMALAGALLLAGCATSTDSMPAVTEDGLTRLDSSKVDTVYWKDGATLGGYERVRIENIEVAFRRNWLRDQNTSRSFGANRVTDEDMQAIREGIARAFFEVFEKELQERGGYELTSETASDVLELRPAIVNLDVNAPDTSRRDPGITVTYTKSAGEMTLNMDFVDAATGDLIGRAIDRQRDSDSGTLWRTNSVTNYADAKRLMQPWAKALREALDEAHGRD